MRNNLIKPFFFLLNEKLCHLHQTVYHMVCVEKLDSLRQYLFIHSVCFFCLGDSVQKLEAKFKWSCLFMGSVQRVKAVVFVCIYYNRRPLF